MLKEITQEHFESDAYAMKLDLSSLPAVKQFTEDFEDRYKQLHGSDKLID